MAEGEKKGAEIRALENLPAIIIQKIGLFGYISLHALDEPVHGEHFGISHGGSPGNLPNAALVLHRAVEHVPAAGQDLGLLVFHSFFTESGTSLP